MDRRTFLRASSASVAPLLAGCIGSPDESGDDGNSSGTGDDADPAASADSAASGDGTNGGDDSLLPAARWVTLPDDAAAPTPGLLVGGTRPGRVRAADGGSRVDATQVADDMTNFRWGMLDPEAVDLVVQVFPPNEDFEGYYRVVLGSFDAASVRERVSDLAHSTEEYRGYDLYGEVYNDAYKESVRDEEAIAVGDGVVIQSGPDVFRQQIPGSVSTLKRVLDVGTGDAESYVAQSDALRSIATRLEPAGQTTLQDAAPAEETRAEEGVFAGMTAKGSSVTFDESTARKVEVFAFESADAASSAPVDDFVSSVSSRSEVEAASHEVDGDLVTVERTAAAAELL